MDKKDAAKQQLEKELLQFLAAGEQVKNSKEWAETKSTVTHPDAANLLNDVVKSLLANGMVEAKQKVTQKPVLSKEGERWLKEGSPEFQIYGKLETPLDQKTLMKAASVLGPAAKPGLSTCMRQKWVTFNKETKVYARAKTPEEVAAAEKEGTIKELKSVVDGTAAPQLLKLLKKRKMTATKKVTWYAVKRGKNFSTERKEMMTDLTDKILQTGSWKNAEFKEYNMFAEPAAPPVGALHPLMKVRTEFRQILLEMGFSEMPTNNFVESSFWNFDTLFQPQQHPARDAHDTFFLNQPKQCLKLIPDYVERVKEMHEKGGHGSIGYRYDWSLDESKKNILRTHTTAVSSRMLYKLAQEKEFSPRKYFSIDRVFRNESLDSTHLAEFHQVEGLIADRGLSLSNLIGTIKTFFTRIGIDDVKFKPAYNPYTEPSMEIFGYSKELKKWIEIGNSGMFRPEMLAPMGLPEDVTVIAWGLSLERPTMIKYGYKNIRDLFGHKVKLDLIYKNPLCRY
mmetsp:Transcript_7951/g.15540  ORF Transcript_7951/g.15540 Transcript_7951/m.15540 type:complete len:509 (+) Transcript_7951:135-1661(+)